MWRRWAVMVVLGVVAAACGEETGEGAPVSTAVPPSSSTSVTLPASTSTRPAPTTSPPATDAEPPACAGPGFPQARPPEEIPWDQVGEGWLLVRYREAALSWEESTREALFLIDPDGTFYAVSGWDGAEILDWSPDGAYLLVLAEGLTRVDLRDGSASVVPADVPTGEGYSLAARFAPEGGGFLVRGVRQEEHATLWHLSAGGSVRSVLADFDFPPYPYGDPRFVGPGLTWLSAPGGGEVVLADAEGLRVLSGDGALLRLLDAPGLGCTLSRWWDEASVLAACYEADWAASDCWFRGPVPDGRSLWQVPVDGSAATRLTPRPACDPAAPGFAAPYRDGLLLDGGVAAQAGGCCECGGGLDLIAGGSVTPWPGYPGSGACDPRLVTRRGDRVLVLDRVYGWDPAQGATGMLGVIFQVAADGTTEAVTPADPGMWGGVQQVLTTEEVGG